jgi:hypothetical protein
MAAPASIKIMSLSVMSMTPPRFHFGLEIQIPFQVIALRERNAPLSSAKSYQHILTHS